MLFAIENGLPYYINNGRAYPVEISENSVVIDQANGAMTNAIGRYSLQEVKAKLGNSVTSIKKTKKKKAEDDQDVL